jgi:hypothetical protein
LLRAPSSRVMIFISKRCKTRLPHKLGRTLSRGCQPPARSRHLLHHQPVSSLVYVCVRRRGRKINSHHGTTQGISPRGHSRCIHSRSPSRRHPFHFGPNNLIAIHVTDRITRRRCYPRFRECAADPMGRAQHTSVGMSYTQFYLMCFESVFD